MLLASRQGFGRLPRWRRRSCLRGYMNRYPVSELDELPEYFVFLPGAVSPARSAASHPAAGAGTRGRDGACGAQRTRSCSPRGMMRLGCWQLGVRKDPRSLLDSGSRGAWVERHYAYFIMCPCITLPNMETLFIQRLFRKRNERPALSTVQ